MNKTILEVVVGSTAHGTSVDDGLEDLDLMSIVIESPETFFGGDGHETFFNSVGLNTWIHRTKPEGVRSEAGDVDHVIHGLKKYLKLAMRNNPTALLPLFVQEADIRVITPEGRMLRALAPYIVSKHAYVAFSGYMQQQRKRLMGEAGQKRCTRPELIERYGYDTKYAGHIIRLGLQGVELLLTGCLRIPMPIEDRELVLRVRTGEYSLEEVNCMAIQLEADLLAARNASGLPEACDMDYVYNWMVKTYMRDWYGRIQDHRFGLEY